MKKVFVVSLILIAIAVYIISYKHYNLGFPVTRKETQNHWIVESNLQFQGNGRPISVRMNLPRSGYNYILLDENFGSQGYGRKSNENYPNRVSEWSVRKAAGPQNIFYRTIILKSDDSSVFREPVLPREGRVAPYPVNLSALDRAVLSSIVKEAHAKSADKRALVHMIFQLLQDKAAVGELPSIDNARGRRPDFLRIAVASLNLAGIPSRLVHGFYLADQLRNITHDTLVEVLIDNAWYIVDEVGNFVTANSSFVPWWRGEEPLYIGQGGNGFDNSISIKRIEEVRLYQVLKVGAETNSIFSKLSIFNLPLATQATFEILLLLPVGALVLIIMRNLIGFKLPGTFLPVLIALSFRHTSLEWGLLAFTVISICGFAVRLIIENFQVLLLSRVSGILTGVVISIYFLTIGANYIDANLVNAMSPFPLVVISGLIERISVVWDEAGTKEAIKQWFLAIFGSILVYFVIIRESFSYFLLVYPETLLIVIALIFLLGKYTGYRLFELFRFKSIANKV